MDDRKRKQEELKYLYKLYHQRDEEFEKAKGRRTIIAVLGFSIFYIWLLWIINPPEGWDVLAVVVIAIVLGVIHVLINGSIFAHLCIRSLGESDRLKSIKKQIEELEKGL